MYSLKIMVNIVRYETKLKSKRGLFLNYVKAKILTCNNRFVN